MADETVATEGSSSWMGLIKDAMNTYAKVEVARQSRGLMGAYEDRDAALSAVPRPGVDVRAASYYQQPQQGNSGLWLLVLGGLGLLLFMSMQAK